MSPAFFVAPALLWTPFPTTERSPPDSSWLLCVRFRSLLHLSSPPSLCSSLYPFAPPPTASLLQILLLHHPIFFFFYSLASFFPPPFLSLLGDPLVTSSLLQFPWFQGKGALITGSNGIWELMDPIFFHKKQIKTRNERSGPKQWLFIVGLGGWIACLG